MSTTINLRSKPFWPRIITGGKSGSLGGMIGGFAGGVAVILLSLAFESPATQDVGSLFPALCFGPFPGIISGVVGGIIFTGLGYVLFPTVQKPALLIYGGLWGLVAGSLLLLPLIPFLEFYATIPAGAIGGLIGGTGTAYNLWQLVLRENSTL